jgi:hypothetical protein
LNYVQTHPAKSFCSIIDSVRRARSQRRLSNWSIPIQFAGL